MKQVTISELKASPAKYLDAAKRDGESFAVVRNNVIEGYYTPVEKLVISRPNERDIADSLAHVIDIHGETLEGLSKK